MAGFETVVRPVVFPNIRPAPAQPLRPPKDESEKGFAVLKSSAGKQVTLSDSYSASTSSSQRSEIKRRVDVARVYQKSDDGTVNKSNYIDVEFMNKAWMKGPPFGMVNDGGPGSAGGVGIEKVVDNYARIKASDNVEILETNVIKNR